jgi:hypothetical protein
VAHRAILMLLCNETEKLGTAPNSAKLMRPLDSSGKMFRMMREYQTTKSSKTSKQ